MSGTSTPEAAREHARAQASSDAAKVRSRPTIPVSGATHLPQDLPKDRLFWDETLDAGAYATRLLERGSRVRLVDLEGDACAGVVLYNADNCAERLNVADTLKVQWQAYLGEGALLLSDMGRVLMSIVRDDSGRHDALCGAASEASSRRKFGDEPSGAGRPSARSRLLVALSKHGLGKRDLPANVNFFKGVKVEHDGSLTYGGGTHAGAVVELRAEMRCLFVVTNAPHVLDPRPEYAAGPLRLLGYRGPLAARDDAIREASAERLRAFQNVDDYYASRESQDE